jgi:membrane-associated phospholipid phosphatase
MLALCIAARAQTADTTDGAAQVPDAPQPQTSNSSQTTSKPTGGPDEVTLRNTPLHLLHDQGGIWSSPFRITGDDMKFLLPLAVATGAAMATDTRAMTQVVPIDASLNQHSTDASNVLIGGFIATPVALYGLGHFKQSPHATEAGILTGEAMLDSLVVEQGMKLIFWRERPYQDGARGHFFESDAGIDSSFPSAHSAIAWSAAAVLAGEYPSRWSQLFIYSAAAGVSVTRVLGQQHFPSDVLVSGSAGWLLGRYVYRHRHKYVARRDEEY